jgi:proteasome assembly chaperone (PAC2) family protein
MIVNPAGRYDIVGAQKVVAQRVNPEEGYGIGGQKVKTYSTDKRVRKPASLAELIKQIREASTQG